MLTCAMILCVRCQTLQNEVVLSPRVYYPNHLPTQFHYDRVGGIFVVENTSGIMVGTWRLLVN